MLGVESEPKTVGVLKRQFWDEKFELQLHLIIFGGIFRDANGQYSMVYFLKKLHKNFL